MPVTGKLWIILKWNASQLKALENLYNFTRGTSVIRPSVQPQIYRGSQRHLAPTSAAENGFWSNRSQKTFDREIQGLSNGVYVDSIWQKIIKLFKLWSSTFMFAQQMALGSRALNSEESKINANQLALTWLHGPANHLPVQSLAETQVRDASGFLAASHTSSFDPEQWTLRVCTPAPHSSEHYNSNVQVFDLIALQEWPWSPKAEDKRPASAHWPSDKIIPRPSALPESGNCGLIRTKADDTHRPFQCRPPFTLNPPTHFFSLRK